MFNIVSAKLTSAQGSAGWSQVYEFVPSDEQKLLLRGRLYIVISTNHVEEGVDVITSGRELFARINEEYFGNLDGKPFFVLKSAIEKVSSEFASGLGEFEIAAVIVLGDVVYSAAEGGGEILISRGGSLAKILESSKRETVAASGYPKEGDIILLATHSFFNKVSLGVLKATLSGPDPESMIEMLAPIVHGSGDVENLGAEILKFETKTEEINTDVIKTESKIDIKPRQDPFQKIQVFFNNFLQNIPPKNIYVKPTLVEEVSPQSKRSTFLVAIILLVLLVVSIGFGIRQKKINDSKNKYQGMLQLAGSEVDQAISLASVSSDRSRELFDDAQSKLTQIEALKVQDPALNSLINKINDGRASILGEYLVNPDMFLDLTLLSSGFNGGTITFSGGQIYVMDTSGSRIVSVDISTKKSAVIAGPGVINSASSLAAYETNVYVLEGDGVYEVDSGSNKIIDKTWSGDALISAFAGNIYIMDKNGNTIYRYQSQNNAFPNKENWLSSGTNVAFSNVSQITIDGSIYALYPNAKVLKFSQGNPQNFSLTGIFPDIGNVDAVYASPDNQYIYLLDSAGKRVVVTDKKGKYVAQYVGDVIANATNLVASEADKKIILLTGDKLYSIDIKQ